jgi:ketosteroid isomerase-like protein
MHSNEYGVQKGRQSATSLTTPVPAGSKQMTIKTRAFMANFKGEMTMDSDLQDFKQFMQLREQASQAYVQGDAKPLSAIVARLSLATFFGPIGGYTRGAKEVADKYKHDAEFFERGSNFTFDILQMEANDGIAYWVGFMRGNARFRGKTEAVPMNLRVTEVFRREGNEWKMVHRHADPLAEAKK